MVAVESPFRWQIRAGAALSAGSGLQTSASGCRGRQRPPLLGRAVGIVWSPETVPRALRTHQVLGVPVIDRQGRGWFGGNSRYREGRNSG